MDNKNQIKKTLLKKNCLYERGFPESFEKDYSIFTEIFTRETKKKNIGVTSL